jgi:hypothetical protein
MNLPAFMDNPCPACQFAHTEPFFELTEAPVSIGIQWPSVDAAKSCQRGDLRLSFCSACGFIWNQAFDACRLEYSQRYDNSLDYSPVFQEYAKSIARRLIGTYNIRKKQVIELGCGKGHFLTLLCEEGDNRGLGFDPSYDPVQPLFFDFGKSSGKPCHLTGHFIQVILMPNGLARCCGARDTLGRSEFDQLDEKLTLATADLQNRLTLQLISLNPPLS